MTPVEQERELIRGVLMDLYPTVGDIIRAHGNEMAVTVLAHALGVVAVWSGMDPYRVDRLVALGLQGALRDAKGTPPKETGR